MLNEMLRVAVIQTSLDPQAAWQDNDLGNWRDAVRISHVEEERARREIRHYLASLRGAQAPPDIVLLPELSVPNGHERSLVRSAEQLESIIIAGLDYRIISENPVPTVSNDALVIVPKRLRGTKILGRTAKKRVGKTYPAPAEKRKLDLVSGGPITFNNYPTVWVFTSDKLGSFGVAVCYDFLDLDRIAMYRSKIQTLFILALNRDTSTFDHLAEAISRMVFCNVVVCNCGHFGGSYVVAPFREAYRRAVYKNSGQKLTNVQIVELPLNLLFEHQNGNTVSPFDFKSLPPGFVSKQVLLERTHTVHDESGDTVD